MKNPLFSNVEISDTSALDEFAKAAHEALRNSIIEFKYPEALRCGNGPDVWKKLVYEIKTSNEKILNAVANRAGVYAILEAKKDHDWMLKYIGQTTSKSSKTRIISHLVWRNKETKSGKFTGSKFDEIQSSVRRGKDIAFSFVELHPAALRQYIESYLIHEKQPEWNFQGTTLRDQVRSAHYCSL